MIFSLNGPVCRKICMKRIDLRGIILTLVFLIGLANGRYNPRKEENEEFCYTMRECAPGSEQWDGLCESGHRQSPIDINPKTVLSHGISVDKWTGPVYVSPEYRQAQDFVIMNSGHTVSIMKNPDLSSESTIYIDGLKKLMHGATHIFSSLHFHWGSDGSIGSEHTLAGQRFAMEAHFVHYNSKYGNFTEAMEESDGLAVFGVLFEETPYDNPALEPIVAILDRVHSSRKMVDGYGLVLSSLLPVMSKTKRNAYHYYGSLTTPQCQESVTWIVFEHVLPVSTRQLERFRSLIDSNGERMVNNFRPTQPRNGRKVRQITVYCENDCDETGLSVVGNEYSHRLGKAHFPFVLIGPKLRHNVSTFEVLLSFVNISIYLLTIYWIGSLLSKTNIVPEHTNAIW